jgi:hypothetical protein
MSMKITLRHAFFAATLAAAAAFAGDKAEIEWKPVKFGGSQEFGSMSSILKISEGADVYHDEWIDHMGAYIIQEAVVDKKVDLRIGLGGVFQFAKPEKPGVEFAGSQFKMFYVGPAVAQAMYKFGNPQDPVFSLGGGIFSYKYNSEAVNLGEYLFRTTPYPTTISTGGLNFVNDNAAYLQGFTGRLHMGRFNVDLLMITETNLPPLYDWSPAIVGQYTSTGGFLDLGLGVNFKDLISIRPSRTSPHRVENSYFQAADGNYYSGNPEYYSQHLQFYREKANDTSLSASIRQKAVQDSLLWTGYKNTAQTWADSTFSYINSSNDSVYSYFTGPGPGAKFYTATGTIIMARGSLAFNKLLQLPSLGENDLKLYFETALLGVKNYPIFYEKQSERMPIMVGLNLLTFKVLDIFAVQFEYFKNGYVNSFKNLAEQGAIPYLPTADAKPFSRDEYMDATGKDDYSWTLLAKKSLYNTFSVSAQLARDHARTVNTYYWYDSKREPNEVLRSSKEWYWMLQFGWNI